MNTSEHSQCRRDESDQVSDDPTTEREYDSVPRALVEQEKVLDLGLALPALARLSGCDHVWEESGAARGQGSVELSLERSEVKIADVGVGEEDICG